MSFENYFPRIFSGFSDLKVFLGFSTVFSFERFFSEISLILFDLNLFSRPTGNGLENGTFGFGGLFAGCGLCTLCAPTPWLSVI